MNFASLRLSVTRSLISLSPFARGRLLIARLLLRGFSEWPDRASFRFRFGRFVDAPIAPWPFGYRDLFLNGVMESTEVEMWSRVLRPGSNVVDGGANFGYWSLVASHIIGIHGLVYAFEPVPSTCDWLRKNCVASQASNVLVHQVSLGERVGRAYIYLAADDPIGGGSSGGVITDSLTNAKVECSVEALDDVVQDSPVRLFKLDIEGAELAALRGARRVLNRDEKPVITFEWNRATARAFGYEPTEIQEYLSAFGYEFFLAGKGVLFPFEERTDRAQWSPMVWALTEVHKQDLGRYVKIAR